METSEAANGVRLLYIYMYINCVTVIFSGVKLGLETSHLAGDSWIQGGTILLDQDGNILYQVHVSEIFKQTSILANDQFLLALKVYTYSKLRVLKLLFHCNDNNHRVLRDYWLWASSFKKIMNMYEFAICMIYFFLAPGRAPC